MEIQHTRELAGEKVAIIESSASAIGMIIEQGVREGKSREEILDQVRAETEVTLNSVGILK